MLNSIEEISFKKRNTCVIVLLNQIGGYLEPKQKSFHRHLLIVLYSLMEFLMICLEFMKVLLLATCSLESMYKEYVVFPPGSKLQESMNHSSHLGTAYYRTTCIYCITL